MQRSEFRPVAVVDVGAARTKVTVVSRDSAGIGQFATNTIDLSLAAAWSEGQDDGVRACLDRIWKQALDIMGTAGVEVYCILGAHAFRDETYSSSVLNQAQRAIGQVNVLTPAKEAALFFSAVMREGCAAESVVAIDVGGGSVQLAWGIEPSQFVTAPLGTYSIQNRFQKDLEHSLHPASDEWNDAYEALCTSLGEAQGAPSQLRALVVGSNVMADFFMSAFSVAGIDPIDDGLYDRGSVSALCDMIGGLQYKELARFFPNNPGFMYGADKLLIVVLAAMDAIGATHCTGTNLSLSKGLASLMIDSPDTLADIGFVTGKL
jgi:exopolyphosphatase/pppGpp-phosphohydrolase